jgi:hypothetical protein
MPVLLNLSLISFKRKPGRLGRQGISGIAPASCGKFLILEVYSYLGKEMLDCSILTDLP